MIIIIYKLSETISKTIQAIDTKSEATTSNQKPHQIPSRTIAIIASYNKVMRIISGSSVQHSAQWSSPLFSANWIVHKLALERSKLVGGVRNFALKSMHKSRSGM